MLSLSGTEEIDLRLTIQARVDELPPAVPQAVRRIGQARPSCGSAFLAGAVVSVAGQDRRGPIGRERRQSFCRRRIASRLSKRSRRRIEPALKADLAKDVMPNIGPDWGVTVFAADDAKQFPHILAALAVKPGPATSRSIRP